MNIYTFMNCQEKYITMFPKLQVKIGRGKSTKRTKRLQASSIRNKSTQNTAKIRMPYYEILQPSINSNFIIQHQRQPKQPKVSNVEMRRTIGIKQNPIEVQLKSKLSNVEMRKTIQIKQIPKEAQFKLKNYQILNAIDKGGFAEVVEVRDEQGNKFAMKKYVLQNSIQCYKNEYMVAMGSQKLSFHRCRVQHDNIEGEIRFKIGRKGYIIQELGGKSLTKTISSIHGVFHKCQRIYEIKMTNFYKQLAIKSNFAKILLQIAYFIKLLNGQGFIHCDLKPENILMDLSDESNPHCKIIDFGSTFRYQNGLPKITITPQYMPPELLIGLESNDGTIQDLTKIDIWSMGCIMFQIMTGVPLWFRYKCRIQVDDRETISMSIFALANREYRKIVKRQKQVCEGLKKIDFIFGQFSKYRKILQRILVYDVKQRANIDEIISMLEAIK